MMMEEVLCFRLLFQKWLTHRFIILNNNKSKEAIIIIDKFT
jgi:hypothetical protein